MAAPQWDNLILDSIAVPVPLDDVHFQDWLTRHLFFISSTMDNEMTPFRNAVRGWIAEGLSRLYFIEAISAKFEGEIERLEVGPVTSSSVRIEAQFHVTSHDWDTVPIEGFVPLQ